MREPATRGATAPAVDFRRQATVSNDVTARGAVLGPSEPPTTELMSFGPFSIAFDDRVLRPRPWTIEQAEWAAHSATVRGPIAELCAGVGHIGLVLAWLTGRDLVLVDADPLACTYARTNLLNADLRTDGHVRNATIHDGLLAHERFAIIIADPPWVPSGETSRFPEDPPTAIDGGVDGMDIAHTCIDAITAHLAPGGVAVLQVGTPTQVDLVQAHARAQPGSVEVVDVRVPSGNGMLVQLRRAEDV